MYFCSFGIKVRMLAFTYALKCVSVFQVHLLLTNNAGFNSQNVLSFKVMAAKLGTHKHTQRQELLLCTLAAIAAAATKRVGVPSSGRRVFCSIHQGLEKMRNDRNSLQIRNKSFHETELFSSTKKPKVKTYSIKNHIYFKIDDPLCWPCQLLVFQDVGFLFTILNLQEKDMTAVCLAVSAEYTPPVTPDPQLLKLTENPKQLWQVWQVPVHYQDRVCQEKLTIMGFNMAVNRVC